jgi:hypothetical protein
MYGVPKSHLSGLISIFGRLAVVRPRHVWFDHLVQRDGAGVGAREHTVALVDRDLPQLPRALRPIDCRYRWSNHPPMLQAKP